MPDGLWFLLGGGAGLIGFANLEAARKGHSPGPGSLLLSCIAGYLAHLHGGWLWDDEQTRIVAAALVFCPASVVLGSLWWGAEGAFGRALIRLAAALGLAVVGLVIASTIFDPAQAVIFALVAGALAFLPWRSIRRARRERQAHRHSEQEERQRQELERLEAEALHQEEQQQTELLQALMAELSK